MDWSTLIERVRRGEEAAGAALVSALAAQLDFYATTLDEKNLLSTSEREDAVEIAMVKVVSRIRDYDPSRATLPTWARGFVRNEMREKLRTRRESTAGSETELEALLAESRERDERAYLLATGAEASDAELAVLSLMLQLKPGDGELIYAHAVERLPFQAIADRLGGVSAAALRKRYQRARDSLLHAAKNEPHLKHLTETETDA